MDGSTENIRLNALVCVEQAIQSIEGGHVPIDLVVSRLDSAVSAISEIRQITIWGSSAINKLESAIQLLTDTLEEPTQAKYTGTGRPRIEIPFEALRYFLSLNFKVPQISKMLGVSGRTIFRRLHENGESVTSSYSNIEEDALIAEVLSILRNQPNTGYKRMKGHLLHRGIKVPDLRVREVMRTADPVGVYQRTIDRNKTIRRRQYFVKYSNQMWHIDGNHKLARWGFVIRGAIDGKSRTITYLEATTDNRADSHLQSFMTGVHRYGVPLRTRSDKGGENVLIAQFMIMNRGTGRSSHICGRSVHNQRIERLWRDVTSGCTWIHRRLFQTMEDDGILNPDDPRQLKLLHRIFLPRIDGHLKEFANGWNSHPISTEGNFTPNQLMLMHLHPRELDLATTTPVDTLDDWDVGLQELQQLSVFGAPHEEQDSLTNPIMGRLTELDIHLPANLDLDASSECFGYEIFETACQYLV